MGDAPVREKEGMTRRGFLAVSGWLALGASTLGTPLAAEAIRFNPKLMQVTGGRIAMGTFVNMALFHESAGKAEEAMEKAYQEMHSLIGVLTCHDDSSRVGCLNRTGELDDVPPPLREVLAASFQFNASTEGAFDITVKPVVDLYADSFRESRRPPAKEQLARAMDKVGCKNMELGPGRVAFRKEEMGVTLDGLAKGYIVDRAMDVLESCGIEHALINAGGDIRVMGSRGDGKAWNIGIQDPWRPERTVEAIQLTRGAIATSGNYEVFFDREKLYHHIVSPRGGVPVTGPVSVSVIAPGAMMADALSTGVFVMGMGRGKKFLSSTPGIGGMIIASDGRAARANWPKMRTS